MKILQKLFLFVFISLLLLNIYCTRHLVTPTVQMKSLVLQSELPLLMNGLPAGDSITLTEYGSLNIWELSPVQQFIIARTSDNSDDTTIYVPNSVNEYPYFIYENGSSYGIYFDSLYDNNPAKLSTDSVISRLVYSQIGKHNPIKQVNDSLVSATWTGNRESLKESYIPKIKKDRTFADSTIVTYQRSLDKFRYSLVKDLENARGIKCSVYQLIYNPDPKSDTGWYQIRRELKFEIMETATRSPADIMDLVERYKKAM